MIVKNINFKYEYLIIRLNKKYYKLDDFYSETANYYLVKYDKIQKIDNIEIKLEMIKKFHEFKDFDLSKISENQKKEILRILDHYYNYGEMFTFKYFKDFLERGIDNRFIERVRLICSFASTTNRFQMILKLGWKEYLIRKEKLLKINPFCNHNGRLSPLSKNFSKYEGLSDEEKEIEIEKVRNKIKDVKKENPQNENTKIEYYTSRGYSLEEAKLKLKDRQTTFSLEKCIEKYGEIEGKKRFEKRQRKWLRKLNNKTEEEKLRINISKGTGILNKLYEHDEVCKSTPGILYFVKFYNNEIEFFKVGITTKTINDRFKNILKDCDLKIEILLEYKDTFYNCYKKEQSILRNFKYCRESVIYKKFSSHECFNRNILNEIKIYEKIY